MKVDREEQEIQINFMAYVAQAGVDGLFAFHVPNGVKSNPFVGSILKKMGLVAGVPDLILIHKGHVFALEIKKPKGKLSPAQIMTMAELRDAGANVAVAYGLDQCIEQLDAWRLTKKYARNLPKLATAEGRSA